jgi:multicomponent Na+:H+ antiporter subunit E
MKILNPSTIVLGGLWWVLAGAAEPASWVIGLPAVYAASALRGQLNPFPVRSVSPAGVVRFLYFFLKMSVASGVDVLRRAFHPRLPMRPGLVTYAVRLTSPVDRIVFSSIVTLLPGTLSVGLEDRRLTVHVLDLKAPALQEIQFIEDLIAGMRGSIARKDP